ncbi:MAG TPA: helix-turn-helix domain-containing protein [Solirubrobacterales bacterium]|nr:helix-turn-helix domain-containing protein [Solirubrobacterales bacterium]
MAIASLRADAARNRARIVAAAAEVFAERGLDASTAEIADRAGVGEATIYRRFPTKDDLVAAIVATKMEETLEIGAECLEEADPWRGLERFLYEMTERASRDQGVSDAAKDRCVASAELAPQRKRMLDLCTELVRRAQRAGLVREDVAGQDLIFLVTAAGSLHLPFPDLREDLWKRYLGLLLDGLRPEGATKLRPGAPPRRAIELPQVSPS